MNTLSLICRILISVIGGLFAYRAVFAVIGVFRTRKFAPAKKLHKYAVVIAARNEETVIGNLLDSIAAQDYPRELVTTFVVADNCTDGTAAAARAHGAVCYERFDGKHCTKGYALEFLFEHIRRDYGENTFEGYFVFDADNLLKHDFISRMNDAFDAGEKIITSYRNTKNFDDGWLSASYALHWLRTVRMESRARAVLGIATRLQGTGYLFSAELVADGWHYTSLTEDREFSSAAVTKGYTITYQHEAQFYDEQPTSGRIAWRQRIRWARGNLWAFTHFGKALLLGIFHQKGAKRKFSCYDMFMTNFPATIIMLPLKLLEGALMITLAVLAVTSGGEWMLLSLSLFKLLLFEHLANIPLALLIVFLERKRIPKIKTGRLAFYCLMFPMFSIIGDLAMCIAVFKKVTWKPIPHKAAIRIEELEVPSMRARPKHRRENPSTSI